MGRKSLSLLMTFILAVSLFIPMKITAFAEAKEITGTADLTTISNYGNIVLSNSNSEILDAGYSFGDVVTVSFAGQTIDMPFCSNYSDIEDGNPGVFARDGDDNVQIAITMGDFASTYKLAVKETADDDSVTWKAAEGMEYPITFTISMKTPGGYYDEYMLRKMSYTTNRDDYPDLTDEQFANFRAIETTGIAKGRLYRSCSPIDPEYNRNTYADAAIKNAGVTVIMNLADSKETVSAYEGFSDSYYSKQKYIPLNMGLDFTEKDFENKLAQGLRFFIDNPGSVYEIHCKEGKDRCGIVSAFIECFMGASYDEVIADYTTSFYNYYGIKPGDDKYDFIVNNLTKALNSAFEITDLKSADLKAEAEDYFTSIGLSTDEQEALRATLGDEGAASEVEAGDAAEATDGAEAEVEDAPKEETSEEENKANEEAAESTDTKEDSSEDDATSTEDNNEGASADAAASTADNSENASADAAASTTYIVQHGDYLVKIAREQLGDANKWVVLYELNRDVIKDPSMIFEGQELKLAE